MRFSAVILAGGKSRRMGRDKAWLEVGGQPLIRRQIQLARDAGATEVFISGRGDTDYSTLGCPVLGDQFHDAGPLAGIERALFTADSALLLVVAVDLPHLTSLALRELWAHCTPRTGAIPRVRERIEPLAAFYPQSAHPFAAERLKEGRNAVREFAMECVREKLAVFTRLPETFAAEFANWNAPDEGAP